VFHCIDQSAFPLAEALHDVIETSRGETERKSLSPRTDSQQTLIANGGNASDKVVDDLNNNSLVVGMYITQHYYR